jgi:hypothetical protein
MKEHSRDTYHERTGIGVKRDIVDYGLRVVAIFLSLQNSMDPLDDLVLDRNHWVADRSSDPAVDHRSNPDDGRVHMVEANIGLEFSYLVNPAEGKVEKHKAA